MDFERLKKLPKEELQAELQAMTFEQRLKFAQHVADNLGEIVRNTFPEAHAIVTEGERLSDRKSEQLAKDAIERIRRM